VEYPLDKRITALALASLMILGMAYTTKSAFAHTFSGDQSAEFLAKVQELKVETHLIQENLSNKEVVSWHIDKTGEFWNANDTKEMNERNQRLAKEIPDGLSALFAAANSTNPDVAKVKSIVDALDNSLAEAVTVRIDQTARDNATINALAIVNVLDETMEDYGTAVGAEDSGSNMTMSSDNSTGGGNMSSMSDNSSSGATATVVNVAAYQTAQGLAKAAQDMFNTLKAKSPGSNNDAISKLDQGFTKLNQAIANKMSNDDITSIVHGTIMTNMQAAYNLQTVPEFPLPLLAVILGIGSVVAYSRIKGTKRLI